MVPKAGGTAGPFVGRARELGIMQAAVQDALTGRGRIVLLSGEPGIGKTRLATELAALPTGSGRRCCLAAATKGKARRHSGPGYKSSAAMFRM